MAVLAEPRADAAAELRRAHMLIDDAWVDALSGATLTVENPAKRRPIALIPRGDNADVNGAVEAASRAVPGWSKRFGYEMMAGK
jgi:succinate-semialdehyde dehydrogenase/glutarate-semialdehyde dehydrogenase